MTDLISDLIKVGEQLKKEIHQSPGAQLKAKTIKARLRDFIKSYFEAVRPFIVEWTEDEILPLDKDFQELLELTNINGVLRKYESLLSMIKLKLTKLDSLVAVKEIKEKNGYLKTKNDELILDTLSRILPSAEKSYRQALIDLGQESRLSYRGPATDLRESLREVLDYLAPDKNVISMPGYKQENDTNGPTMKQKVKYILKARERHKPIIDTVESATQFIDEAMGSFVRSLYTRSSLSTHTPTDKAEVLKIKTMVEIVFCDILEIKIV